MNLLAGNLTIGTRSNSPTVRLRICTLLVSMKTKMIGANYGIEEATLTIVQTIDFPTLLRGQMARLVLGFPPSLCGFVHQRYPLVASRAQPHAGCGHSQLRHK